MSNVGSHRVTLNILPFENLSEDGSADYFSRGFVADLVAEFSRFSELAVVSRRDATSETPLADYALRGALRREGERLRVSAELLDAATGAAVWADRLEREGAGVFAIQDEICGQVVSLVSTRLRATLTAAARRKCILGLRFLVARHGRTETGFAGRRRPGAPIVSVRARSGSRLCARARGVVFVPLQRVELPAVAALGRE